MYDIKPVTSPKLMDCGATSLKMLLSYYGTDVDLDQLAKECNTRLGGCSAGDIMRAGKLHGFDLSTWAMGAEEVIRQDRPSIIWWRYDHFCICCGTDDNDNIVIINPDRGLFRMSFGIFKSLYSGVAIFNGFSNPCMIDGEFMTLTYEEWKELRANKSREEDMSS